MTPDFADSLDGAVSQVTAAKVVDDSSPTGTEIATANTELITEPPVQAVAAQIGDVAVDVVKLLELQVKLFESELAQSSRQLVQPLVQFAGAYILGTASLIVLLFALSAGLQAGFGMPNWLALLIVALLGAGVAAIAVQMGITQLKTPRISFTRSKEELIRNAAVMANLMKPPLK